MLEAIDIYKTYIDGKKQLHVLKGIDLKIEKGGFVSIFGPSGAGKSTLLHILGGLDEPTKGKVIFEGENLYNLRDEKIAKIRSEKIGFVFQFYHLLPEFTAVENVMLPAMIKLQITNYKLQINSLPASRLRQAGKFQIPKKAEDTLKLVGLGNRINHRPGELSGGEQQRVAIARALINEPDILFCDEPTGNLDSETGDEICKLLKRLNKEKDLTLVVVTHEEKIAKLADRIIHIKDGKIQ